MANFATRVFIERANRREPDAAPLQLAKTFAVLTVNAGRADLSIPQKVQSDRLAVRAGGTTADVLDCASAMLGPPSRESRKVEGLQRGANAQTKVILLDTVADCRWIPINEHNALIGLDAFSAGQKEKREAMRKNLPGRVV